MATDFVAPGPWSAITRVCRRRGPRFAAVAFVGKDAPTLMPLKAGDVLVVNAGTAALLARATHPDALAHYLARGVQVFSCTTLHAKVVASMDRAVVGSANASHRSTTLDEAAVSTDEPTLVAGIRNFVERLVTSKGVPVDEHFIEQARATWQRGRSGGPPGTDGSPRQECEFIPRPIQRIWVMRWDEHTPSDLMAKTGQRELRRNRSPLHARYVVDYYATQPDDPVARGDLIIYVGESDSDTVVYPPVVALGERVPVQGTKNEAIVVHMRRDDLVAVPLPRARATRQRSGFTLTNPNPLYEVKSPAKKAALLDLWSLTR